MNKSNTKNDVVIIHVTDLDANRKYFRALGFEINEMTDSQFMASMNDKIVGVVIRGDKEHSNSRREQNVSGAFSNPLGHGIEIWFSVSDISEHYQKAVRAKVNIVQPFGNRGYGPVGDYGTRSPDGYLFFFSQPPA